MRLSVRQLGHAGGRPLLCLPGFGDNGSMFDGLADTPLADRYAILAADLPWSKVSPNADSPLSLESCGDLVHDFVRQENVDFVVAHSVTSIVASLAASRPGSPIDTIVSLEGNLTAEDAYFSGTAADYDDPLAFHAAFLDRLASLAEDNPVLARYRTLVATSDPVALWKIGSDTRRFSESNVAGDLLVSSARRVHFLYNPDNCPTSTLAWLARDRISSAVLEGASHWATVDQPEAVAAELLHLLHQDEASHPEPG